MADSGLEAMLAAGGSAQEEAAAGAAAASDAVPAEELVPHIARGANTAIYGYDIANMKERPWAQPGANLADYFNYDFDEPSYRAFCAMHAQGSSSVKLKAEQYVTKLFGADAAPQHAAGSAGEQQMHHQHGGYGQGAFGRGQPGAGGGNLIPRAKLHKTKPCYAFRDGLCQRGDNCPYAHGEQELQHGRAQLAAYEAEFGGGHGQHGHHHGHHHHHHHSHSHHGHHHHHHHHGHSHGHGHSHHHHQHQQPYGMQQHRPQPPAEGRPEGVLGGPPASAPAPAPAPASAPAPAPAHVSKGDEGLFEAPPGPG